MHLHLPRALGAGLLMLGCGDRGSPTDVPDGPAIVLKRVEMNFLACTGPCGVDLTYEARRVDTNELAAVPLRLAGDGWYTETVRTTLPDGRVSFMWEYPLPKAGQATYRLKICPEVGSCDYLAATVGVQ